MAKVNSLQDLPVVNSSLSSGTRKSVKLASKEAFLRLDEKNGVKNGVTLKAQLDHLKEVRKFKLYKEPKVIRCKSGDWYIQFYFLNPQTQKFKAFKERAGVNRLRGMEKEVEAKAIRKDISDWLAAGNSPFDIERPAVQYMQRKKEKVKRDTSGWTIAQATAAFLADIDSGNYKKNTIRVYKKYIKCFQAWVISQSLVNSQMCEFTEMALNQYLAQTSASLDWSATTYNNYLGFMVGFIPRCLILEKLANGKRDLTYDFDGTLLKYKQAVAKKNQAIDPVLRKKIIAKCEELELWMLRDYLEWIYLSSMRPDEIREMRVKDVDTVNRQVKVPKGKTGFRLVPMSDQLLSLIEKRGLSDPDNYVFGMKGHVGSQRMGVAYFLDQFSLVRDALKFSLDITPYSLKPTGIIAMIMAGIPDRDIMMMTGHKSEKSFNAYKRGLVVDSKIMKGSTINF